MNRDIQELVVHIRDWKRRIDVDGDKSIYENVDSKISSSGVQ